MLFLKSSPMARLLFFWVLGIVLAHSIPPFNQAVWMLGLIALMLMAMLMERLRPAWRQRVLVVMLFWLGALPFGLSVLSMHLLDERNSSMHFYHVKRSAYSALVRILAPPENKPNTLKLTVQLIALKDSGQQRSIEGKMWLYISKKGLNSTTFNPGQLLYVRLKPSSIPKASLPGAFDYARYAAHQQIYASAYVPNGQWIFVDKNSSSLATKQWRVTRWLKTQLAHGITEPEALGIAEALLFGNRSDIDKATWQAYARSGIVHVIAISGMHLGLVYSSLVFLFSWLPGKKRSAVVPALLCLWLFAWITGMPASVMRAAWMFTIIGVGQLANRTTYTINTMLASALLILIIDPWQLYDLGFQLSYWAVLSLHFFYSPFRQKLVPLFPKILAPVAQLVAATLSAQVLTTPWLLYLFHQVPLWVILTNLIAVPWSTILIYAELIWVFLWPWHQHLLGIGKVLTSSILALNQMALWVSARSDAVWQTHAWTIYEMLFFYAMLAAIYIWMLYKKTIYLLFSLWALAGLFLLTTYESILASSKQGCIVYYQKPNIALHVFARGQQFLWSKPMPATFWQYQWQPLMAALHLDSTKRLQFHEYHRDGFNAIAANGKQLVYLEKSFALKQSYRVDILVLGGKCRPGSWLDLWQAKVAVFCSKPFDQKYIGQFDSVVYMPQNGAWIGFTSP